MPRNTGSSKVSYPRFFAPLEEEAASPFPESDEAADSVAVEEAEEVVLVGEILVPLAITCPEMSIGDVHQSRFFSIYVKDLHSSNVGNE